MSKRSREPHPTREPPRRSVAGGDAIDAALRAGEPVRVIVVRDGAESPDLEALLERGRAAGAAVHRAGARHLRRLAGRHPGSDVLAMVGSDPRADGDAVLAGSGVAWLVVDVVFPGNAGFVIRTAEVSGADGVFIDAAFDHAGRRETLRQSMRADRFMPVHWESAEGVAERAAAAARRLVGLEVGGSRAPWEADLRGRCLFVVGGEERGIPQWLLDRCDPVIHVPMAGFITAYNLQTAVAAVTVERFRQLAAANGAGSELKPARSP